jgi:hypothetical protein
MGASPFFCRSAQTEEGKNGHDDHDKTNEIDDAVHDFLHECDGRSTSIAPRRSTWSGQSASMKFSNGALALFANGAGPTRWKNGPTGPLSWS